MIETVNRKVCCTPFQNHSVQIETKQGFAVVKNKSELLPLKVVFGAAIPSDGSYNNCVEPGATVWVKGECVKSAWAAEQFSVEGKEFILVPVEQIVLIRPASHGSEPDLTKSGPYNVVLDNLK